MHLSAITPEALGSDEFRAKYGIRHAYLAGSMYKGIASTDLVIALAKASLLGFFGSGGLDAMEVEAAIVRIKAALRSGEAFGMNLLADVRRPDREEQLVDLYLRHGIRNIEAASFMRVAPSLVRYRLKGLHLDTQGEIVAPNRIIAKVSRPEIAAAFMQPPPEEIVRELLGKREVTDTEALLGRELPIAEDICVEADSGGHTDQGAACAIVPAMLGLRDRIASKHRLAKRIRIGAAGGIGTPHAAAAAFILGADFIVTGSINQCTREAGTSEAVKELLQELDVRDTTYAPAGDLFELGARIQVASRGVFFAARANRLYGLYQHFDSLEAIEPRILRQIENNYFKQPFASVWAEVQAYYSKRDPAALHDAERNPKKKLALMFKWYFARSTRLALMGEVQSKVDFQVHCGPAMGAFNQWVKGTELCVWRNRYVADIADRIMRGAAQILNERFAAIHRAVSRQTQYL